MSITSIPANCLFKDGALKSSMAGARPKHYVEKEFAEYLLLLTEGEPA